ncbi:MAG: GntR family transcriptional regulator [Clostridia bacterium]|jgi:DNA-binding GntR family transcriptional regulator|nr:GntR family transcriptional regulator [Clostridia bacterium]
MEFSTKNSYIYESLKEEIITSKLRPGERIIISEVAKRYNVSPMPIREAINRLQQDGFVEVIPHVGARVSSFDLERHKELMMIRIELETLAIKLSTPYIDDEIMAKLEKIILEMEEAVRNKENRKYGRLNVEFHHAIYGAGPHKILYDLITTLWGRSEHSRAIFESLSERNAESLAEHIAMVEAIKSKDGEKASEILRKQKEVSTAMHIEHLKNREH